MSKTYTHIIFYTKGKYNSALTIYKKCKKIEEIKSNIFSKIFHNLKTRKKYDFSNFEIEISTLCRKCVQQLWHNQKIQRKNINRIKKSFKWKPKTLIKTGLEKTILSYEKNLSK